MDPITLKRARTVAYYNESDIVGTIVPERVLAALELINGVQDSHNNNHIQIVREWSESFRTRNSLSRQDRRRR
ncbi:hypothetical protein CMUS01_13985 [Colletotrichum musicola]|uniref:Uncharacterized protein n=1 Tax=Colletotrichum musicola TaxID=2175873 RepID=A0A8H6J7N6_9PEZI|nr:hypothetical protein CMUS01_13985 [Colletotrichum musicola]